MSELLAFLAYAILGFILGLAVILVLLGLTGNLILLLLGLMIIGAILYPWYLNNKHQKEIEKARIRALGINDVDSLSGEEFEHYVAELLTAQKFKVTVTKYSGDMGADIIATKNGKKYAIQTKRLNNNVNRRAISDAVTAKSYYQCSNAMVVTNSYYTKGALDIAEKTQCELIDRDKLADWILKFQ